MNLRIVTRNIGIALLLNAIFMFLSAGVSLYYNMDESFSSLLLSGIITSVVALFPLIFVTRPGEINAREGLIIVVFSWILSCLFGMLPYILYGGEFSIINSWYESVSGYTTTGATILQNVEAIPKGLLFWRASTHWLGGMGVVLFMLLILPTMSTSRMKLSRFEISSLSKDNFKFRAHQTVRVISLVYVGLTLAETLLLMLAGMDLFDATCHSFSTIATGGFSTRNLSVASFDSPVIDAIIMVFMMLSAMHFGLLYSAAIGHPGALFRSPIIRYYVLSMITGGIMVSLNIFFNGFAPDILTSLRYGFFQVISIGTTTGFANADSSVWPGFSILLLIFFGLQCGCSGSTTGGLKVDRIWIFLKSFQSSILKQIHPNAVIPVKVGDHTIDKDTVSSVTLFITVYLVIVFIVTLLLTLMGVNVIEAFSGSVANMGNSGPGFGSIGSLGNYSAFPAMGKLLLSIQMLLGRVEIYSIILVFIVFRRR